MKKIKPALSVLPLLLSLVSCGDAKKTVSVQFDQTNVTDKASLKSIQKALEDNGYTYVESNGDYQITLSLDSSLTSQGYSVTKDSKTIQIKGGDATGLLYGAYQLSEDMNLKGNLADIENASGTPYLQDRGFRLMPLMDARTPCYTANADATRANFENTYDLTFWEEIFSTMSYMRYNLFDMATLCALPSMVKVPGYEDCALNDVYCYDGEYDDSYHGNATDMFREEHVQEGNYHVLNHMTIEDKITHWQNVISLAHTYGIKFQMDMMNIYTFGEAGKYGITSDRDNTVTKDYMHKGVEELLKTYDIDVLNCTAGENMDYPETTQMETEQWIYDVYGQACIDAYGERTDKKDFVFTYSITEENWSLWKDFPFRRTIATRYANTHMYAVTKPIYTKETRDALPEGTYDTYNLRNEDAYHFTWADPTWAREFCKNMKDVKSTGFVMGSAGYYMGKEYEFKDDTLNGNYYYKRHWLNYTLFGRFSYNPDLSDEWLDSLVYHHYKDVDKDTVTIAWNAIKSASQWLCEFQRLFYTGGTDSSWYPETCQSHPNLFGYLDIKRFVNSDNAYEGSDNLSFAEYARLVKAGQTQFTKKTPVQVAESLRNIVTATNNYLSSYDSSKVTNTELNNLVEDQKAVSILASFYAEKIDAAVALRQYNDTKDVTYQNQALEHTDKVIEYWNQYSDAFLSRFKAERFARVGIVDPSAYKSAVAKDKTTIQKWTCRDYD